VKPLGIRDCARNSKAFQRLLRYYSNREEAAREFRQKGGKVVGQLGADVPDELIIAAGMFPLRIYADRDSKLIEADKYLEFSFDPVIRAQFEKIVDGTYSDIIDYLAISNSTDVIIRTYLYLREIRRREPEKPVPPLDFIDWLFTRRMLYQVRNEFTVDLFRKTLEEWSGREISDSDIEAAAKILNNDRAALREISALRKAHKPRISGSEALVIIGSSMFMDRAEHAELTWQVASEAKDWPEIDAKRIFLTGSAHEYPDFYEMIERNGGVVVGEDHDWGDRHFERDYNSSYSPTRAIVDRYMLRSFSSKKAFVSQRVQALDEAVNASQADAVIFYVNMYEESASWDYPSQKKSLEDRGIATKAFVKMAYPVARNEWLEDSLKKFIDSLKE